MDCTDRCDKCGAQARSVSEFKAGKLMFCGHHWREHEDIIRSTAISYYVEPEFDKEWVKVA